MKFNSHGRLRTLGTVCENTLPNGRVHRAFLWDSSAFCITTKVGLSLLTKCRSSQSIISTDAEHSMNN